MWNGSSVRWDSVKDIQGLIVEKIEHIFQRTNLNWVLFLNEFTVLLCVEVYAHLLSADNHKFMHFFQKSNVTTTVAILNASYLQ